MSARKATAWLNLEANDNESTDVGVVRTRDENDSKTSSVNRSDYCTLTFFRGV